MTCLVYIYSRTPGDLCVFKDVFVQKFHDSAFVYGVTLKTESLKTRKKEVDENHKAEIKWMITEKEGKFTSPCFQVSLKRTNRSP